MTITVDSRGIQINLDKAVRNLPAHVDTFLGNTTRDITLQVQALTPVDLGTLKADIGPQPIQRSGNTATQQVSGRNVKPVVVASVETGTKPHWPPWGPGSALEGWANRKGIPPFLVARAIATKGTIKRFGRPKGGAKMMDGGLKNSSAAIQNESTRLGIAIVKDIIG